MGTEAYRSLYGDLAKLKDMSLLDDPASGGSADTELFQLLLAVSEAVDNYCNRHFYALTAERYFDSKGDGLLNVPDLIAVMSLATDEDDDGEYETAWDAEEYQLLPLNAAPAMHWGTPYNAVRVRSARAQRQFTRGQARVRIAGRWGYREHLEPSGSALASSASRTASTLGVDRASGFAPGQTIAVGAERMLVTGASTRTVTVARGLNGTRPGQHERRAEISLVRWPAPVERAALINAARIWTRAPAFEPFYVGPGQDTDVRTLLEPYRLGAA